MNDFAPVAEYRGVAILERTGTVRAVWNGSEYRTDGKVYVWFQTEEPAQVGMIEFPTERDVKEVLDVALVGERLLNADTGNRYRLLSRGECIAILCRGDPAMMALALAQEPCRTWDEGAGVFVHEGERPPWLEDGPHRHGEQ